MTNANERSDNDAQTCVDCELPGEEDPRLDDGPRCEECREEALDARYCRGGCHPMCEHDPALP